MTNPNFTCKLCKYYADFLHDGEPLCYLCVSVVEKAKREAAALLTVTREAGNYADAEQAAYYSTPAPRWQHSRGPESCEDFYHACPCGACKTRERWLATQ